MLPDPLHPAVVHFPIVLAVFLPLCAVAALVLIRRGTPSTRAWAAVLGVHALLLLSAWAATGTGEQDEERVEGIVAEEVLEEHEEAGERFLTMAAVTFLISSTGLLRNQAGRAGRLAGTVGALLLFAAAIQAGHTGGELVYKHGAGEAYGSLRGTIDAER